jgi:hypothetical protein
VHEPAGVAGAGPSLCASAALQTTWPALLPTCSPRELPVDRHYPCYSLLFCNCNSATAFPCRHFVCEPFRPPPQSLPPFSYIMHVAPTVARVPLHDFLPCCLTFLRLLCSPCRHLPSPFLSHSPRGSCLCGVSFWVVCQPRPVIAIVMYTGVTAAAAAAAASLTVARALLHDFLCRLSTTLPPLCSPC